MNGVFLALTLGRPSSKVGEGALTPPTVAPVLSVSADFGSSTANLSWTASDKTTSDGFAYLLFRKIGSAPVPGFDSPINYLSSSTLSYNDNVNDAAGDTYYYLIVPSNSAGDGPSSNTASVILPGII